MILGKSGLVVGVFIAVLGYLYLWLSRPDLAQSFTKGLFSALLVVGKVVYRVLVALFGVLSRMSLTGLAVTVGVVVVLFLFVSASRGAHCDC